MQQFLNSLFYLFGPNPIYNGVQGSGYEVMKDIEQDQDVHRDPLSGHICQHHNQRMVLKKEDEDEMGAACAQDFPINFHKPDLKNITCRLLSLAKTIDKFLFLETFSLA